MRFDPGAGPAGPGSISMYSALSVGPMLANFGNPGVSTGNGGWPSANLAIGCPFVVPGPILVKRLVSCGHTNIGGRHFDLGIYDHTGRRLVSTGSIANSVAGNGPTVHAVTNIVLVPDETYYYAIAMDNNSDNAVAISFGGAVWALALMGFFESASSFPLPDPIVLAEPTADYMPSWQVLGEAVGI